MSLRLGSLFSGAGGLDLAVEAVFGAETRWVSDIIARDKHGRQIGDAPRILAHRFPGIPNLGDITTVDWAGVEPVDIVAGGSPCQDVSTAGKRAGMVEGTRSTLWVAMRDAISHLQPAIVIWENVRGSLTARADSALESDPRLLGDHQPGIPALRAAGRVLGDLASLGFDAAWCVLPAAAVGAPHGRKRIFVVAAHPERIHRVEWTGLCESRPGGLGRRRPNDPAGEATALTLLPTPAASNPNDGEDPETWLSRSAALKAKHGNGNGAGMPLGIAVQLLPTPKASNNENRQSLDRYGMNLGQALGITPLLPTSRATDGTKGGPNQRGSSGDLMLPSAVMQLLPTPSVADATGGHERRGGKRGDELLLKGIATHNAWGPYAAAIARWEALTRPAPQPTIPSKNGRPRLNPQFSEWMQGWPAGWVTDVPGMRDTWKHHAIGNGVVPQQASAAIRWCLYQLARVEALGGAA